VNNTDVVALVVSLNVTKTVNLSPKSDWYVVPGSTKMLIHVPLGEIRYCQQENEGERRRI